MLLIISVKTGVCTSLAVRVWIIPSSTCPGSVTAQQDHGLGCALGSVLESLAAPG